jgi:hypothetical protein
MNILTLLMNQGRALSLENKYRAPLSHISDAEFKIFSQFGEDGVIQYLIHEVGIKKSEEIFIEFGVQNYEEANTKFLLLNNNWKGLIMDSDAENIRHIKAQDYYWRHDLTAIEAWITRENINSLITEANFSGSIGLLSIDIDGNDYWVWEKISVINPVIVIIEYNSVFGNQIPISVPYKDGFRREVEHYSHLFAGSSIAALAHLGKLKNYSLIGSNLAGNNLFFVRDDRVGRLKVLSIEEAFVESRFRESRDKLGNLDYLSGKSRLKAIEHLEVVNVVSGYSNSISRFLEG